MSTALDGPQRAAWLIGRREQLIEQLPRRIRRARAFPRDLHELIVDEAIEFVTVRHDASSPTTSGGGRPLEDLAYAPWTQAPVVRLEELRAAALELRVEAELALRRHGRLVGELQALVAQHPLRGRLWGQLITALYRHGR